MCIISNSCPKFTITFSIGTMGHGISACSSRAQAYCNRMSTTSNRIIPKSGSKSIICLCKHPHSSGTNYLCFRRCSQCYRVICLSFTLIPYSNRIINSSFFIKIIRHRTNGYVRIPFHIGSRVLTNGHIIQSIRRFRRIESD